jgi:hypothetical protein
MSDVPDVGMTRRDIVETGLLSLACVVFLLGAYYVLPMPRRHEATWWRLSGAIALFVAVLVHELRSILRHDRPMRRAVIAVAVVLPLFVVTFAWLYLTMSRSEPATFAGVMSRTKALYFTITVLSTVGFGDIVPRTDPGRAVTMVQMVLDLILLAVIVRLIFGAATLATRRRQPPVGGTSGVPDGGHEGVGQ